MPTSPQPSGESPGPLNAPAKLTAADMLALLLMPLIASGLPISAGLARSGHIPSIFGGMLRFGFAGAVISLFLLARGRLRLIQRRDAWTFIVLGFVCVPVNQFSLWEGVARSNPSHAAMIYAGTPVAVTVMTCAMRLERWSLPTVAGALLAVAGVLVILMQSGLQLSRDYVVGDLLLVVAMATWALYLVMALPLNHRYGSLSTQVWAFLIGAVLCLPLAWWDVRGWNWRTTPWTAWGGLAYMSIMVAGVNFFLFQWSMTRQPPSRIATFSNAAAPLTLVWRALWSHDPLTLAFLGGSALLLLGMAVTLFGKHVLTATAEESAPGLEETNEKSTG